MTEKWSHDQLARDLANHLRGNSDRMVWTDMQMGPSGSPRPDVYTIAKSYSRFTPISYECKISVSDFRSDVTTGKWQKYLKFSSGVIFAVPKGLVTKADIPKGCGLVTRNEDGWVTVKAPTLNRCETLSHHEWMKLLIDGVVRAGRIDPETRLLNQWQVKEKIRKKYGEELAAALSNRDATASQLERAARINREEIERVNSQHAIRMKKIVEEHAAEARYIDRSRDDLCKALGLPAGSGVYEIARAMDKVRSVITADKEVARMTAQIVRLRRAMKSAMDDINEVSPLDKITTEDNDE
jgi:hypothetical protein